MNEIKMTCDSIVQNVKQTTAILHSEDRSVAMNVVNPPMRLEPGKTYVVSFAEIQEG